VSRIDLNADIGEGFDESDLLLLDVITSANVACGFHAGGEGLARPLCAAANARGVSIGAHISYRDRDGFGRRDLDVAPEVLEAEAVEQIDALSSWCDGRIGYVKPHGALYHRMQREPACGNAMVRAARGLPILGLDVAEGFADRGYAADGTLVPRGEAGALLDPDAAVAQALRLAHEGRVRSICLHGDSPGAPELGRRVREALEADGVELRAFA